MVVSKIVTTRPGPGYTYRAAVYHAAADIDAGWELETFPLKIAVYLAYIAELVTPLGGGGPGLDQLEYFGAHLGVDGRGANSPEKGD